MTFSETLTSARKRRGWSQEEWAARNGASPEEPPFDVDVPDELL